MCPRSECSRTFCPVTPQRDFGQTTQLSLPEQQPIVHIHIHQVSQQCLRAPFTNGSTGNDNPEIDWGLSQLTIKASSAVQRLQPSSATSSSDSRNPQTMQHTRDDMHIVWQQLAVVALKNAMLTSMIFRPEVSLPRWYSHNHSQRSYIHIEKEHCVAHSL